MRATGFVLLTSVLLILSCARDLEFSTGEDITPRPTPPAIVEGSVFYFEGGGTAEMVFPPGFRLAKCRRISFSADSSLPIYLCGGVDSSHITKRVRVYGTTNKKKLCGSLPTYVYYILELNADSLLVI